VAARPHPWDRGTMALAAAVGHVEPTGLLLGSLGSLAPPKASATAAPLMRMPPCGWCRYCVRAVDAGRGGNNSRASEVGVGGGGGGGGSGAAGVSLRSTKVVQPAGLLAPCARRVWAGVSLGLAIGLPCLGVCSRCTS
jgi:hypothetical protein